MDAEQREAIAGMWATGDYARVATRLAPAAHALAERLGDGHGRRALDVATGTGSVARALASRGWAVSATDLCRPLLDHAARAAEDEGLVIDWQEGPIEEEPYGDASFSAVTSSFGLIFAPDPDAALRELRRCLLQGGALAFTAWTPGGYMGAMTAVMGEFLPGEPGAVMTHMTWGDPGPCTARLQASGFERVEITARTLPWNFADPDAAVEFYFTRSPAHVAAARGAGDRAEAMKRAVREHLASYVDDSGRVTIDAEYLLVTARRAA